MDRNIVIENFTKNGNGKRRNYKNYNNVQTPTYLVDKQNIKHKNQKHEGHQNFKNNVKRYSNCKSNENNFHKNAFTRIKSLNNASTDNRLGNNNMKKNSVFKKDCGCYFNNDVTNKLLFDWPAIMLISWGLKYIFEYMLRLMTASCNFISVITPIVIHLIYMFNCIFTKIIDLMVHLSQTKEVKCIMVQSPRYRGSYGYSDQYLLGGSRYRMIGGGDQHIWNTLPQC